MSWPAGWFEIDLGQAAGVVVSVLILYPAVVGLTRLFGLRSFSKLSAPDAAMTIATGSILGSAIATRSPTLFMALLALTGLFAGQRGIAALRRRFDGFRRGVDNRPVLLVWQGRMLEENMVHTQISAADIRAMLRQTNVHRLADVSAVIFETTGDFSVMHGQPGDRIDARLLADVADPSGRADLASPSGRAGQGKIRDAGAPTDEGVDRS